MARRVTLKADLDLVYMDIVVVLGRTRMPIHKLLRMGRGAVIELAATETDQVEIMTNEHPFARGQILVNGTKISIEITELLKRPSVFTAVDLAEAA